jgi:two-component system sensor histidine kinase UhpB
MNAEAHIQGLRILLVEDDLQCGKLFKIIVESGGAVATHVTDAEDAVKLLDTSTFDAVVTDIRLPGMDGIALLRHIRQQDDKLPVIVVSAYSSVDTAIAALQLGAQDYLVKPLGASDQLIRSISHAVDRRKLVQHNELLKNELAQREAKYRSLFHNTSVAIFLHKFNGKGELTECVEANDVACQQLGYTSEELLGMTLQDFTAEERRRESMLTHATLVAQGNIALDSILITKEGKRIPVELKSHTLTLNNDQFVVSLTSDISKRRQLERRLADSTEGERTMIGRELHDVLCQDLASIAMLAGVIKQHESTNPAIDSDIELIHTLTTKSVSLVRNLCAGLMTSELENDNLAESLAQLTQRTEAIHRTSCTFESEGNIKDLDKPTATQIFRIAQESINNAARHSDANNVRISLKGQNGIAVMTVEDDGTGMEQTNETSSGWGLSIMKHRANVVGAALDISSRQNGGTIVTCQWIQGNGEAT